MWLNKQLELRGHHQCHIVYKGNGKLWLCAHLRKANKAVTWERFLIPRIHDLLRQLSGAKMFSTLDLRKAYWQIQLSEGSREITSSMAAGKINQFNGVPFELASAPEAYQRVMSIICEGLAGVLNYFDDVVVYRLTPEEHWKCLRAMLHNLRAMGLRLNAMKCVMGAAEIPRTCYFPRGFDHTQTMSKPFSRHPWLRMKLNYAHFSVASGTWHNMCLISPQLLPPLEAHTKGVDNHWEISLRRN